MGIILRFTLGDLRGYSNNIPELVTHIILTVIAIIINSHETLSDENIQCRTDKTLSRLSAHQF